MGGERQSDSWELFTLISLLCSSRTLSQHCNWFVCLLLFSYAIVKHLSLLLQAQNYTQQMPLTSLGCAGLYTQNCVCAQLQCTWIKFSILLVPPSNISSVPIWCQPLCQAQQNKPPVLFPRTLCSVMETHMWHSRVHMGHCALTPQEAVTVSQRNLQDPFSQRSPAYLKTGRSQRRN